MDSSPLTQVQVPWSMRAHNAWFTQRVVQVFNLKIHTIRRYCLFEGAFLEVLSGTSFFVTRVAVTWA